MDLDSLGGRTRDTEEVCGRGRGDQTMDRRNIGILTKIGGVEANLRNLIDLGGSNASQSQDRQSGKKEPFHDPPLNWRQ